MLLSPHNARYRIRGMRTPSLQGKELGSNPQSDAKIKKNRPSNDGLLSLAADLGFEPRHTESESAVLPLHNSALFCRTVYILTQTKWFVNRFLKNIFLFSFFCKKGIDKRIFLCYNCKVRNGRLAQLGEHLPYKQRVTGSSPVLSTKEKYKRYGRLCATAQGSPKFRKEFVEATCCFSVLSTKRKIQEIR